MARSVDPKPRALHLHPGCLWNANLHGERFDLWHASIGFREWLQENGHRLAEVGSPRNADPEGARNPAFATGGIIYSANSDLDIDERQRWLRLRDSPQVLHVGTGPRQSPAAGDGGTKFA
jgi:hypothetical protein